MIRSLQLIDSLNSGGAERMAVNIANSLSRYGVESHICTTRAEGSLKSDIDSAVGYFYLGKKAALDLKALKRLKSYIKNHKIEIIHAHGTSFFTAFLIGLLNFKVKIVWHDHFGNRPSDSNKIAAFVLRLCSLRFSLVYCVNVELEEWATKNLKSKKVKLLYNYPTQNNKVETSLQGLEGKRILSLANLREPKNHILLFKAFREVVNEFNEWTLHVVGKNYADSYVHNLEDFIEKHAMDNHIFIYGSKNDISNIIRQSNIGVLSSTSEGLPMALLEYGLAGLPVITTDVGHCKELISDDTFGLLVPSEDKNALTNAIRTFIRDQEYRATCAKNFQNKVQSDFSESKVIESIVKDYQLILESA